MGDKAPLLLEPKRSDSSLPFPPRTNQPRAKCPLYVSVLVGLAVVGVGFTLAVLLTQGSVYQRKTWMYYSTDAENRSIEMFRYYLQIRTDQPRPDYRTVQDFVQQIAEMYGFEFRVLEYEPGRPNSILTWRSPTDDKSIVLYSHSDVVPAIVADWHYDPFGAEMDDQGNIYARGAQDMKCNAIQYIAAVHRLKQSGYIPNITVHILFGTDEEIGGGLDIFTSDFWSSLNVQLVFDEGMASPDDRYVIYNQERSIFQVAYNFSGKGGHGSLFHNNSAIEQLHRILDKAYTLMHEQEDLMATNNLSLGRVTTINPCVIIAGVQSNGVYSRNVVPSNAYLQLDIRITPGQAVNISHLVTSWGLEEGAIVNPAPLTQDKNATVLDASNPWWVVFNQTFQDMNLPLDIDIFPAGTSGGWIRDTLPIPVFGFSPMINTPRLLHDNDEFLNRQTFLNGIDIYEKLFHELLKL